ncbi:hypothetical protein BX616_001825 [Lobosporangium transversale]|nr:hypothetical protein BX616_001825 [Lobosporangium transversale]
MIDVLQRKNCSVDAKKMLKFFEEVAFKRTVKKYIDPNAGFSDAVGKAPSQAAKSVLQGKLTRESMRKPKAWKAETEESTFQDVVHELEQNHSQHDSQPYGTLVFEEVEEAFQDDKDDAGSEDEEHNHSQPPEEEALMSAEPQALMVFSIAERTQDKSSVTILPHLQTDETGRKFIYAPISIETVDCARKALIYLFREQASLKVEWPNPAPHPRKNIPLKEAIEECEGNQCMTPHTRGRRALIPVPFATPIMRSSSFGWPSIRGLDKGDVPNFTDPDDRYNIKLLVAASTIERRNARLRKNAVAPKTQIDATASVMRTCDVYSTKVTHAGRHAGTSDAYRLGLGSEHIHHLGRWVIGQMESFCASKNPTTDLITEDELHWGGWQERMRHSTAARDQDEETTGSTAATTNRLMNSAMIDRRAFLLLLVRMRRVILQDTVLYLKPDSKGRTLRNRLLESLSNIFESQLFLDFQAVLLRAIEVHQQNANVVNPMVPVAKHVVSNALNNLSHKNASLEAAIARQGAQMAQQEAQQRIQLACDTKAANGNIDTFIVKPVSSSSSNASLESSRSSWPIPSYCAKLPCSAWRPSTAVACNAPPTGTSTALTTGPGTFTMLPKSAGVTAPFVPRLRLIKRHFQTESRPWEAHGGRCMGGVSWTSCGI